MQTDVTGASPRVMKTSLRGRRRHKIAKGTSPHQESATQEPVWAFHMILGKPHNYLLLSPAGPYCSNLATPVTTVVYDNS